MTNDFKKMQERALEIKAKYAEIENKKWGLEQQLQGLMTDVGELAELIMAHEGYKKIDDIKEKLEHELADIMWSVIVIADKAGIDLEASFYKTMDELDKRIDN